MPEKLIMIIEDDEDISNLFALVADAAQCKVEKILTGTDAVKRLAGTPVPDMVVLDLHLPGMGGDKVLDKMRKTPGWENIPLIIVTAYPKTAKQVEALASKKGLRLDGIYYKTEFNIDVLHQLIKKHLNL